MAYRLALPAPWLVAIVIAGAAPFGVAAAAPSADAPAADDAPRAMRRLVVRLRDVPATLDTGATGFTDFDRVCREHGVLRLRPLSAAPAAAHRSAATFAQLGLDRIVRIEVAGEQREALFAAFKNCREVARVDRAGGVHAAKNPNDPNWNSQWAQQNGKLDMPKAWSTVTDATGVPVAVIDSGSDLTHSDFKANRWINSGEIAGNSQDDDGNGYVDDRFGYDFVNDDGDPADDHGHGTNVAGVIGAVGDNAILICGICWKAEVMSCKSLDDTAFGTFDELAEGIIYAVDNGARVSNMSFVSDTDDATLRAAIDYARTNDVVQVAAAGNNGNQTVQYPAAYDGVLAVIATDSNDNRWSNSSFGIWCDVAAPGVSILTLKKGGNTQTVSGTSLAAPHVAGIATLVRKVNPDLDRRGVELTVSYSAEDLGTSGFDNDFGWGRVNGDLAVDRATMLRASATEIPDGGTFTLALTATGEAGFLYFLFPSFDDRVPGIPLAEFDGADARVLPLNEDWLFDYVVVDPSNPFFVGFQGVLDTAGTATATVDLPPRAFDGLPLDFAFVTLDPADLTKIVSVSEPTRVWIR